MLRQIAVGLVAFEFLVGLGFALPLSFTRSISFRITGLFKSSVFLYAVHLGTFLSVALLGDSIFNLYTLSRKVHSDHHSAAFDYMKMLEHQRDLVLYVALCFLPFLLSALHEQIFLNNKMTLNFEVMKKQAEGAARAYMQQREEKSGKPAEAKETKEEGKKTSESSSSKSPADLEKELNSVKASLVAMKKQAESQQAEYDALTKENKSLKNQLEDFQLILGDKQKKAV
eukprot:GILI01004372.1.p2 GENE.GILI01004372.1~~GILI01004372.1.p2  ORF type:complete len:246 (+),score=93.14 GILI01004372.1:57-740(+)